MRRAEMTDQNEPVWTAHTPPPAQQHKPTQLGKPTVGARSLRRSHNHSHAVAVAVTMTVVDVAVDIAIAVAVTIAVDVAVGIALALALSPL
jgi:hypothetical protein